MKYLPWVGGGLAVILLLWVPQCAPGVGSWGIDTATVMAGVRHREAEAEAKLRAADSLERAASRKTDLAERTNRASRLALASANSLRDSVLALGQAPDSCLPWVGLLRREADSLRSAVTLGQTSYDSIRAASLDLRLTISALRASDSLHAASVDSLSALVRRAPVGCKLLGLIPCPSISAGISAVASQGRVYTGPGATAGWTIALGKK